MHDVEAKSEGENEDDLLYGDNTDFKMPTLNLPPPKPKVFHNWWKKYIVEPKPTYWMFVVRENSNLEIYSVPEFQLCFIVRNLGFGYKVLIDSLETVSLLNVDGSSVYDSYLQYGNQNVKEILMVGLGNRGCRPILLVRLEKDLYLYEVFRFSRGNLKLRFKKMKHGIFYAPNLSGIIETENPDFFILQEKISKMRYFGNIAGKQ